MKCFLRLFVVLLAISCGQLQADEATQKANEIWTPNGTITIKAAGKWGDEASGVSCRITTDKNEYHIGEPVFILVEIKNNTSDVISIGVEPMVKVRNFSPCRQPFRLQTVFFQRYKGRLGFFSTVEQSFPPGKAWDKAQTIRINPGEIYSQITIRAPWGMTLSASPSKAQLGAMSLEATYMQHATKDSKRINAKSNLIQFVVLPKNETLIDKNIKAGIQKAIEALKRKDYKSAEEALTYVMILKPRYAEACIMLGRARFKQRKKEMAKFTLEFALGIYRNKVKKSPKDWNSLFQQAFVLMLLKRPEKAKKILEQGRKQFPGHAQFKIAPTELQKAAQNFLGSK